MKVVEGDVNGELQGGVMSPGAMAIEGSDLKVNGNVSGGLVSDGSTVTVNGNGRQQIQPCPEGLFFHGQLLLPAGRFNVVSIRLPSFASNKNTLSVFSEKKTACVIS